LAAKVRAGEVERVESERDRLVVGAEQIDARDAVAGGGEQRSEPGAAM
jgi:hypothetical protein